jgi:hypothetical protein
MQLVIQVANLYPASNDMPTSDEKLDIIARQVAVLTLDMGEVKAELGEVKADLRQKPSHEDLTRHLRAHEEHMQRHFAIFSDKLDAVLDKLVDHIADPKAHTG